MVESHRIDALRPDAPVFTSDGTEVGKLHAVVVDPAERAVTHLAINTGPHFPEPGFGDPRIVSIDIACLGDATTERVDLTLADAAFGEQPLYEQSSFFEAPGETNAEPPVSRLWNTGVAIASSLATLGSGIAVPAEHFRRARFERHILKDAPVWRVSPSKHIGDVESVIINEDSEEIEGLVIRRGVVFHEDVVLPIGFVTEIRDGVIHADISDADATALAPQATG
jgi:sporulation protein YlmC with PRC-barrel domain